MIPSLQNRARTLRLIGKYIQPNFRAQYAQAIFKSKILFAAESWGGASRTLIKKVQSIQDRVVKNILGPQHDKKLIRQKHLVLKWLSVRGDIEHATNKFTFKILNDNIPEEMSTKMKMNLNSLRMGQHRKLESKPRWLSSNKTVHTSYRAQAYKYNTLPEKVTYLI